MIASDCVNVCSPSRSNGTSRDADTDAYDSLNCSLLAMCTGL